MIKTDALIIGAGPTGLFTAHQLKLIGLNCEVVDNLDKIGGQCIELYPDKPIYDIPAVPECTGEELTINLINQLKPFDIKFHLAERVDEVKKESNNWIVKTNNGKTFSTPNVIIAGGVGSFEPRKFSPKECEQFEDKSIFYSIKDKKIFVGKTVTIFGGGDSALDWAVELSKTSTKFLNHRVDKPFRYGGACDNQIHKQRLFTIVLTNISAMGVHVMINILLGASTRLCVNHPSRCTCTFWSACTPHRSATMFCCKYVTPVHMHIDVLCIRQRSA